MEIYYLKNGRHMVLDMDSQYYDYMFDRHSPRTGCNDITRH